jgi:hypothetical protein
MSPTRSSRKLHERSSAGTPSISGAQKALKSFRGRRTGFAESATSAQQAERPKGAVPRARVEHTNRDSRVARKMCAVPDLPSHLAARTWREAHGIRRHPRALARRSAKRGRRAAAPVPNAAASGVALSIAFLAAARRDAGRSADCRPEGVRQARRLCSFNGRQLFGPCARCGK